jgi:hypothetical protein
MREKSTRGVLRGLEFVSRGKFIPVNLIAVQDLWPVPSGPEASLHTQNDGFMNSAMDASDSKFHFQNRVRRQTDCRQR